MSPPLLFSNRPFRFSVSASRPTFPPGDAFCSMPRTTSISPRIGRCSPAARSFSPYCRSTSSATGCATRWIPAPRHSYLQTVRCQEAGPTRESHLVDFVAVAHQAQQAAVGGDGGAARQGEPPDLFGSVDARAQRAVEIV